jgi:hypothetical protein
MNFDSEGNLCINLKVSDVSFGGGGGNPTPTEFQNYVLEKLGFPISDGVDDPPTIGILGILCSLLYQIQSLSQTLSNLRDDESGTAWETKVTFSDAGSGIGNPNDAPATNNTGAFNLLQLQKRLLELLDRTINVVSNTTSNTNNTIFSAPAGGATAYISYVRIQNKSATPVNVVLKAGNSQIDEFVLAGVIGDGQPVAYPVNRELKVGSNQALNMELSAATNVSYTIAYFTK